MRIIKSPGAFSCGEQTLGVCLPAAVVLESHTAPADSGAPQRWGGRGGGVPLQHTDTFVYRGAATAASTSRPGQLYFIHQPR